MSMLSDFSLDNDSPHSATVKKCILKKSVQVLSIVTKVCGVFYYVLNNVVWVANMGALPKDVTESYFNWRQTKDVYSLIKTTCESIKSILKLRISLLKQNQIEATLFPP